MSTINTTYHSDVVLGFKQIPEKNFSRQIYFIEKHRDLVENMDSYFRIDLLNQYNNALFEIGHFRKCLDQIEALIYDVINENFNHEGEDLFCILLKRKASALYHIGEFEQSVFISSELIKINPDFQDTCQLITSSAYRLTKEKTKSLRALAVMMLIFGITVTCFDLLVIQNFYPEQIVKIGWLRISTIGGAAVLIFGIEAFAFIKGKRDAKMLQKAALIKHGRS